ncbi:hypothetical protein CANINC_000316 [Pichia inconspicua]|uniref:Uncharacterized protein n=1 Tax=Pichia inconspicua TaxID=52247 RepID=A0A4T0X7X3_9ASCO|nr:hypothetical protein CANINC_000316 [[Candida] inconspicua]
MDNQKLASISVPDNDLQHSMMMSTNDPNVDATAAHNAFLESLHGLGMLNDLHLNQLNNQLRYELRNLNREVGVNLSDTDEETEGENTNQQDHELERHHENNHPHDHDAPVDEDELSVLEQSFVNAFSESESEPFRNYIKSIVERGYLQTDAILDLDEKEREKMSERDRGVLRSKIKDGEDASMEDTDKDPLLDLSILGLDIQKRKRKAKDVDMDLDLGYDINNYGVGMGVPMSIMNRPADGKYVEESDHKRRRRGSDDHYTEQDQQQGQGHGQGQQQSKTNNSDQHLLDYNIENELRTVPDVHHELNNYVNVGNDVGVEIDLSNLTNMNMGTSCSNDRMIERNEPMVNVVPVSKPIIVEENIKKCSRCRMKRIRESEKDLCKYQTCQQCRERRKVKEKKPRVVIKLPNLSDDWDTFLKKVALNTVIDLTQHNYGAYTDKNEFPRYSPEELTIELMNDIGAKIVQKYIQPLQKITGFRFAVRDHHNPSLYDPNRSKKMTWMFICSQDKLRKRKSRSENKRHVSNKLKTEECCSRITLSYDIVYGILQMSYNHKHHKPLSTNSSSNSDNDDEEMKNGGESKVLVMNKAESDTGVAEKIKEQNSSSSNNNNNSTSDRSRDEQEEELEEEEEEADREVMEAAAAAVAAVAAARDDKGSGSGSEEEEDYGGSYNDNGGVDVGDGVEGEVEGEQPDHVNVDAQFERIEDIIGSGGGDGGDTGDTTGDTGGVDAAEIARLLRQVQAVQAVQKQRSSL